MKIIVTSVPLLGHLNAVLAVGRMLIDAGHEVVGLSATHFRDRIEAIGARFHPFSDEADVDASDMLAAYPDFATIEPGPAMTLFYFQRVFADPLGAQYRGLREVMASFAADLVVADNLFFGVLPFLLGERSARPAILLCGTTFLLWHRPDRGPCNLGLPPARDADETAAYAAIADDVARQFADPFAAHIDRCLASAGAPPLPMDILDAVTCLPDAHIQLTVPAFEYPRPDLPDSVRFVGALPITPNQAPLPPWADDLDGSQKVVMVTQGTLSNHDFSQLVEPTLSALADRPELLVVVTTGGRPVDALTGPLPANARVARYLPFEWLLPKVDVLVTNGGYNTVNQALSHGIPVVAAGLTEDKADVSARVAWAGAGIDLRTNAASADDVRDAVDSVLGNPTYKAGAMALADAYRQLDTRAEVMRVVSSIVPSGACAHACAGR
jgi:MGT family glycosyltransferase